MSAFSRLKIFQKLEENQHITAEGNAVIGIDLLRNFGVSLPAEFAGQCTVGYFGQSLLDLL